MPDRFQFYAASRAVSPGKGTGESIVSGCQYSELSRIPTWRTILSNLSEVGEKGFTWNGSTWRTVEHAFQAQKFVSIPGLYMQFTMESNPTSDGYWARKNRKAYTLNPAELADWDRRKSGIMKDLWLAKFTQDPLSKKVLLATGDAELWHSAPRMKAERWLALEEIREMLRTTTSEL